MNYYLIANIGSYIHKVSTVVNYPRHLLLMQVVGYDCWAFNAALALCESREVILDNGAYEGFVPDWNEYANTSNILKPWCTVLPDIVRGDAVESRDLAFSVSSLLNPEQQCMYVPQGRNKTEVLHEFQWAFANLNPELFILGLGTASFYWGTGERDRIMMLQEVLSYKGAKRFRYHMLGARQFEIASYENYPNVIGIDTFKPCRWALAGKELPSGLLNYRAALEEKPGIDRVACSQQTATAVNAITLARNIKTFCEVYGAKEVQG